MDAYSLALAVEGVVIAASGLAIAYLAGSNAGVVLYSRALAVVGGGLVVGGAAAVLLAAGAGAATAPALVAVSALPFGLAGWRIATDTATGDHDGVYVAGGTATGRGFEGER